MERNQAEQNQMAVCPMCFIHKFNCWNCPKWEPIPFHDKGGICLVRSVTHTNRWAFPDFIRKQLVAMNRT